MVITGASSHFGHHFARVLHGAGARVVLGARHLDHLNDRVTSPQSKENVAIAATLDVNDAESCESFLETAASYDVRIDVLINNAGVLAGAKTYTMISEADWDYMLDTNLKPAWRLSNIYTELLQRNA